MGRPRGQHPQELAARRVPRATGAPRNASAIEPPNSSSTYSRKPLLQAQCTDGWCSQSRGSHVHMLLAARPLCRPAHHPAEVAQPRPPAQPAKLQDPEHTRRAHPGALKFYAAAPQPGPHTAGKSTALAPHCTAPLPADAAARGQLGAARATTAAWLPTWYTITTDASASNATMARTMSERRPTARTMLAVPSCLAWPAWRRSRCP